MVEFTVYRARGQDLVAEHAPFKSRDEAEMFASTCAQLWPEERFSVQAGSAGGIAFCDGCGRAFDLFPGSETGSLRKDGSPVVLCAGCRSAR